MVDYVNELHESVLEAYTGVIQGLKGLDHSPLPDVKHLEPHLEHIVAFLRRIVTESDNSDSIVASAAGVIGDLCSAFGPPILRLVEDVTITQFLAAGKRSKASRTKTLCTWATKEIKKLRDLLSNQ